VNSITKLVSKRKNSDAEHYMPSGIYLQRNSLVTNEKELGLAINKICVGYFNGLLEVNIKKKERKKLGKNENVDCSITV
jgi:hypothetical protein